MPKFMSWYCMDSALARDPKIDSMPDNDHRWVWVCLLGLEKGDELEGQNVSLFAKHCNISRSKMDRVLYWLKDAGMVDKDSRPMDFQVWQDRALKRSRNQRAYKVSRQSVGSQSVVSTSYTETDTETDKKKNKKKTKTKKEPSADARVVLEYLNRITGRSFGKADNIDKCMRREKASVQDCMMVIDSQWSLAQGDPERERWVDVVTPWRPCHFSDYLDIAKASNVKQGLTQKHSGVY